MSTYSPNNRIAANTFNKEVVDTSVINLNQYQDDELDSINLVSGGKYEIKTVLDPETGEYKDVRVKSNAHGPAPDSRS